MVTFLADDFTAPTLRGDLWTVGHVNGAADYAGTIDPSQVVPDAPRGLLHLTASLNPKPPTPGRPYLTGVIRSQPFLFGSVQVNAKMPKGRGLWPALWMLTGSGVWPPEIDLIEVLCADPTTGHATYHWTDPGDGSRKQTSQTITGTDLSAGFHTYGVDWQPGSLTFTLDGQPVLRVADAPAEPMYLLLSMQVGTAQAWGGAPDSTTVFPASLDIAWVTVEQ